jgi:hypothetical protein
MMAPARAVFIAALLALAADAQINDPQVPQVIVPATTVRTLTRAGDTTVRGATLLGCPPLRALEKTQKNCKPSSCLITGLLVPTAQCLDDARTGRGIVDVVLPFVQMGDPAQSTGASCATRPVTPLSVSHSRAPVHGGHLLVYIPSIVVIIEPRRFRLTFDSVSTVCGCPGLRFCHLTDLMRICLQSGVVAQPCVAVTRAHRRAPSVCSNRLILFCKQATFCFAPRAALTLHKRSPTPRGAR